MIGMFRSRLKLCNAAWIQSSYFFTITILKSHLFLFLYRWVCVCMQCSDQKMLLDCLELDVHTGSCELGCWESNTATLEAQPLLLTPKP